MEVKRNFKNDYAFAFVEFENWEDTVKVREANKNLKLDGRDIKIEFQKANPRERSFPRHEEFRRNPRFDDREQRRHDERRYEEKDEDRRREHTSTQKHKSNHHEKEEKEEKRSRKDEKKHSKKKHEEK